jgi:DNA-binding LytR/AlgR family response regulator
VLAFLIRQPGASQPLHQLLRTWDYYLLLLTDLAVAGVIWETNRYLIRYLDRHHSWLKQPLNRFLLQGALVVSVSSIELLAIQFLANQVLMAWLGTFRMVSGVFFHLSPTIVFVWILNTIYTGMYMARYHRETVARLTTERDEAIQMLAHMKLDRVYNENSEQLPGQFQKHLIVNYGLSSVPLPIEDVAYIFRENEVCLLKTFDGKEFTSASSLESLEAMLSPVSFFRINRQMLAHIRSIKRFRQDLNGKLSVEFFPVFSQEVFVSKKKAPEFREWLGKKI